MRVLVKSTQGDTFMGGGGGGTDTLYCAVPGLRLCLAPRPLPVPLGSPCLLGAGLWELARCSLTACSRAGPSGRPCCPFLQLTFPPFGPLDPHCCERHPRHGLPYEAPHRGQWGEPAPQALQPLREGEWWLLARGLGAGKPTPHVPRGDSSALGGARSVASCSPQGRKKLAMGPLFPPH